MHFGLLELQGTVENRSLLACGVAFIIFRCWKDGHLQTSEYTLQVKYKGEVRTITGNVHLQSKSTEFDKNIFQDQI